MREKKSIDITKTEESGADTANYGDSNADLALTHYLGNDELRPRQDYKEEEEEDSEKIGKVAYGNVDVGSDHHP